MEYVKGIEKMLFMTSHNLRQPIVQIIGMTSLLNSTKTTHEDLVQITEYMKKSLQSLDSFSKELTLYANNLHERFKNSNQNKSL